MSQENVEIVRRAMDALNQLGGLVAGSAPLLSLREFFDPDVEWDLSRQGVDPGIYHGYEGWLQIAGQYGDAWQEFRLEVEEIIDAGVSVVVFTHNTGLAKSGIKVGVTVEMCYEIWDRASVRIESVREADDRIARMARTMVRGGLTGIEVEMRWTGIWRFTPDGRACRWDSFNEDDAAGAAFLAE